ncbi:uncharacterized protein PGTG_11053 [Puccinia graminis f. sp. tritici CRL 75-36-700-3]|uniref:Uncharacterized protein n=1 Tax=Puccinia graminis f. sp. tritici (strain CRL 75-36-700-3 / race SCCL) TaxID=418459 RepID=E3KN88_PUCGT|nr:uncharacterized protein PGTG_11053 [Puccinia graminis f. sp. tritici CRL 75-36-700-3]EFP85724.2 hypothetical protein PGTG_11053 [Puccinia graminis f. sp. tritici CRL 75-36-700-3]
MSLITTPSWHSGNLTSLQEPTAFQVSRNHTEVLRSNPIVIDSTKSPAKNAKPTQCRPSGAHVHSPPVAARRGQSPKRTQQSVYHLRARQARSSGQESQVVWQHDTKAMRRASYACEWVQ